MRRTKEQAAETRQELLKAALVVFSRKGYATTTLNDIADEAKVTRGAIYWHFGSKAELYNVLVEERFAEAFAPAAQIVGTSPLDTLQRLLHWSMTLVETDPSYRAVLELTLTKTEALPELSEGMAKKAASLNLMIEQYRQLILQAVEAGEVRQDVDTEAAALGMVGMMTGVVSLSLLNPQLFSIQAKANSLINIFLNGLR